jgi:formate dehydrogenase subunit gamma
MNEGKRNGRRGGTSLPVISMAPWQPAVEAAILRHRNRAGGLLPLLHEVQRVLRHVPPDAIPFIANAMNLSRAEVHGVVSFYHDFRESPAAKHMLRICRAESCQAVGANELLRHAESALKTSLHGTSADGSVTLEAVYCLGNCALSPAVELDGMVYGRVSPERLDALLADAQSRGGSDSAASQSAGAKS